ncbi:Beta-lactamase [Gracilaria domingensis]|nr:Beta-lactamase [Gracilaria domingensis]
MIFHLPSFLRYLPRRAHVFSTAAVVYLILKTTQIFNRTLRRNDQESDEAWIRANTRAAQRILRTSTARRGLWIKCCQYVAARSDALPPEYSAVLSKSLDDCPPTPPALVEGIVTEQLRETEYGKHFQSEHGRPININDVFHHFDSKSPIASASIAQVHIATLKSTGRKVVLKVQHPGIRPMLLQDLEDLKTLLIWIAGAEPKYDMRPVLDAWIEMVPLETNFLNELSNLEDIKSTLRDAPEDLVAEAYVPEPIPHLTSDKLLVMEYIDGCKVSDVDTLSKYSVDRDNLITNITRSFGLQLFVGKVFSGDPHPGNFLVNRLENGGQPVLLDFGICVRVEDDARHGFAKMILAAVGNDSYSIVQSLSEVGVNLNRADPTAALDMIKYLFRTTAPPDESMKEQSAMRKKYENNEEELERNAKETPIHQAFSTGASDEHDSVPKKRESRSPVDSFPGDLVFFFRSLGMLRGLASSLGVRHSYLQCLRPYAEYAVIASCPTEERMKEIIYKPIVSGGVYGAERAAAVLEKALSKFYELKMLIGMQVAAYKNGELVLNIACGQMGRYDARPVTTETLFNSFSCTKGLTSILFAHLQDEYDVKYGDLVTKYWPDYGQNGKQLTTIGHILSHSAGLAQALPEDMNMIRLRDDWEGIIRHFETAKPAHPPGERSEYHALSFGWLVAGLIVKITGKTYQHHLRELVKKLNLESECFCGTMPDELLKDSSGGPIASLSSSIITDLQEGALGRAVEGAQSKRSKFGKEKGDRKSTKEDQLGKTSVQEDAKEVLRDLVGPSSASHVPAYLLDPNFFNHPILRAGFVPSANGHFTAKALAKLYAILSNEGQIDGNRIMTKNRVESLRRKLCDVDGGDGRRAWGPGLMLYDATHSSGEILHHGALGHGGIGGSFAFAVPSERFSMAVTLNKLNAMSVASAAVIALVCLTLDVPMPGWYHNFAQVALKSFLEEGTVEVMGEADILDNLLRTGGESDIMKMLLG